MVTTRKRSFYVLSLLVLAGTALGLGFLALPNETLFYWTGETNRFAQARALWNMLLDQARPPLNLAPDVPIQHRPDNPFGVNTFLEGEVEVAKRERTLQMIREAGYGWIRQPFVWSDIEIHGKGDFEDRRNVPYRSAWEKYDNIVDLAERYGLKIIARVGAPPKWAHRGYADLGDFGPPADFNDFADFVEVLARRYVGRIRYWQIWNEPNIYPEWGNQRSNPEDYTRLLCLAHDRLKAVDPSNVVIAAALAPTLAQDGGGHPGGGFNDLIFLERMYAAGAARCFDVAAAQGYGLFSGPFDRRRDPLQTNVARHMLMRDIMVRHGDAHKPIWLSEVNWNAVPNDPAIADLARYGMVTPEEQARFVPLLYERARAEWPWIGVMSVWFFKRPSDQERNQSWYYFRMLEPDFTPTPLWESMRAYIRQRQSDERR
ncbi:MAG: cellulase family glycosylhydrolase [Thermoflexales bacterium]|nr:cellulase family glycosylhydrolase [Thermoflexales bacterium]